MLTTPRVFAAMVALGIGAPAVAAFMQHMFDARPCPWCALQRLIFVAIALAGIVGLVWRASAGRVVAALLALGLAGSGIAAAGWQHFVAAKSASCNLTFADRVLGALHADTLAPWIFAPTANCADAVAPFAGLPYEVWSFSLYVLVAIGALWSLARGGR